jgi:hypothetical protein
MAECMPSKNEALNSNPVLPKKKKSLKTLKRKK